MFFRKLYVYEFLAFYDVFECSTKDIVLQDLYINEQMNQKAEAQS